jgi:hypothetical protein
MSVSLKEFLSEFQVLGKESLSLGFKEILKSAPCQAQIPRELLDWVRQSYIEGVNLGIGAFTLESLIRTIAIKEYYSPLQIQSAIDRVKLELQNQPKIITKKLYN